jgi:SnoaL-like domain
MLIDELLAREGIRKTLAKYNVSGDRLRIEDYISVFTENAIFESEGVLERDAFNYVGRQNIRDWFGRWLREPDSDKPSITTATFIRHHLSTCHIELIDEISARARTYWVAYTDIGPDHCGHYVDRFELTAGDWLISHRRVRLDWRSAGSLYFSAIENTNL